MKNKKAWHFYVFIGYSEAFDNPNIPITTYKVHAIGVFAVALNWNVFLESVEVFRITR